jgi:hypothetical protein
MDSFTFLLQPVCMYICIYLRFAYSIVHLALTCSRTGSVPAVVVVLDVADRSLDSDEVGLVVHAHTLLLDRRDALALLQSVHRAAN